MTNQQKYLATSNRGRNDANKLGWKIGDIFHLARNVTANQYKYCGYEEIELPRETRVRIIGVYQTNLNSSGNGIGDVYIDFECVDVKNQDGTPVTCGNRHAWTLLEANPDFMICPDGSGDLGTTKLGHWKSISGGFSCSGRWVPDKVINLR